MAEAPLQHVRRGRKLLSMDLSVLDVPPPVPQEACAIPQFEAAAVAVPAQRTGCFPATQASHRAYCDTLPASLEEHASSLTSAASDLSRISTRLALDALSNRAAPPLHAPRATPGAQSSMQLGPIRQPLQGPLPPNPLYIARALAQAPLQHTQQLYSGWNAVQLLESQQHLQRTLTAACAVGYAQGIRQGAALSQSQVPLTFSRQQGPPTSQHTAQHQRDSTGRQASLRNNSSASPASGHKRSNPGLEPSSTKRQRLVYIAEPQHSAPPPLQGLIKFKCSIADMIDAFWPIEAAPARLPLPLPPAEDAPALRQLTAAAPSTACPSGVAPQYNNQPESVKPAEPSCGQAVPCRAIPSLGRRQSSHLLPASPCAAAASLPLALQAPAATADAVAASTAAVESLTIDPEAHARRSMLPPLRATAQSVLQRVAAAQAAGWADFALTASGQHAPLTTISTVTCQPPHGPPQGSASTQMQGMDSTIGQVGVAQAPGFTLSSFPQVMSQLLSEPSMQVMLAWVAAHQPPPAVPTGQQDIPAANPVAFRPQKRARQGEPF